MGRRRFFCLSARAGLLAQVLLAAALLAWPLPAALADSWDQVPATQRSVDLRVPPQLGGSGGTTGVFQLNGTAGGSAIAANCNATGDTPFTLPALPGGYDKIATLDIVGESGSFTTAKIGIYTAPGQGGAALVAQTALSAITTTARGANGAVVSLAAPSAVLAAGTTLYFNVGTAQGGACAANFYFGVNPLPQG